MRVLCKSVVTVSLLGTLSFVLAAPASGEQPAIELKPRFGLALGKRAHKHDARHAWLSGRIGHVQSGNQWPAAQITGGSMWLPRGLSLHGEEFPSCLRQGMDMAYGTYPERCPKGSIVGGPLRRPITYDDGVRSSSTAAVGSFTDADYLFVNGGARRIMAYMTIYNPALVREPTLIEVHELRGRKWSYRFDFSIPKIMLVVAGMPIALRSFDIELDGIERAPGYLTSVRRCPKRGHLAYRARLSFLHNDGRVDDVSRRARLVCQPGRRD